MSGVHLMQQPRLSRKLSSWQDLVVIAVDAAFRLLILPVSACLIPRSLLIAQCHTFIRCNISRILSKYSPCSHLDASSGIIRACVRKDAVSIPLTMPERENCITEIVRHREVAGSFTHRVLDSVIGSLHHQQHSLICVKPMGLSSHPVAMQKHQLYPEELPYIPCPGGEVGSGELCAELRASPSSYQSLRTTYRIASVFYATGSAKTASTPSSMLLDAFH